MKTIAGLVDAVTLAATEMGIDLSPKDTGFIVSSFLEGLINGMIAAEGPRPPSEAYAWLQTIADACSAVKNQ